MTNERSGGILRTALCALAALLVLAAPALASSDGVTNYRALLIGNSVYQTQANLPSCAYDLSAMKSALASGTVGFKKVSAYSNLTQSGIQSALSGVLAWGADEDDVTVFYYTGHGASGGLAGVDYGSSGKGLYSFSLLHSALSQVPGKVIVLLDACQSGGLIGKSADADSFAANAVAAFSKAQGDVSAKAIASGDKFHVIASSSQSQSSYALDNQYGLTTWALCEAMGWAHNGAKAGNKLETLEGDANGDLTVTVGEAFAFASDQVSGLLKVQGLSQDMQAYPENSGLMLITRAAADPAGTSKTYKPGALNFSKACIAPGRTLQLQLNVADATQVHWSTSKSSVAAVDGDTGLVTGVNYSYSIVPRILVNYRVGSQSFYAYCDVRVLPERYVVRSVQVKYPEKTLEKGAGYTMPVKILPASARYKSLRWTTSDSKVATVTAGGRITAVAESGTAVITATATSGATAAVTVTAVPAQARSVSLNYKTRTLIPGQSFMLTQTVLPAYAADKSVTWASSDESVATVDDTGLVTANKDGVYKKAVISATTKNGKAAYCTVNVVRNQSIPRTRPKSAYGRMVSSANRIYYQDGALCVDMWFNNRTRYTQTAPDPNPGLVVLKLRNAEKPLTALKTFTSAMRVPSGAYRLYAIRLNLEDYPNFMNLDLRGSDAWYEAKN